MTKRKPIKLWAFKGKTLNWVHITTDEPEWDLFRTQWCSSIASCVIVCAGEFEKVLGEQLWPYPYLAEMHMPLFKVVKYWEPA